MTDKLHSYLGLSKKSGQLVCGAGKCESTIKGGTAAVVLIAADASTNTKKHFADMAEYRSIPCACITGATLESAIGSDVKTVCITGKSFADAVIKEINLWGSENE